MPPGRGALTGAAPLSPLNGTRPSSAGRLGGLNTGGALNNHCEAPNMMEVVVRQLPEGALGWARPAHRLGGHPVKLAAAVHHACGDTEAL